MATKSFQGTMDEILLNLRRILWNFAPQVGMIKDFIRIGILQDTPLLPAVAIVPARMEIIKRYSNGWYAMGKQVEIHVFDSGGTVEESHIRVRKLAQKLRDVIIKDLKYQLDNAGKKTAWNFDRDMEIHPDRPIQLQRGLARQATIPITFMVKQQRPTQPSKNPKRLYCTDDMCVRRVHDALFRARKGDLNFVREFRMSGDPPVANGLTVGTTLTSVNPEHYAGGIDNHDLTIVTRVWSKLGTEEQSFLSNVRAAEKIHEIWERDETFGGAFMNTELQAVDFSTRVRKDIRKYETSMTLVGRRVEPNYTFVR